MDYLHGKFVWFEHLSHDVDAARRFYGELLGWKYASVPMGEGQHDIIMNGADPIGGFRAAMPGMPSAWMGYLSVADCDAGLEKTKRLGAQPLAGPADLAGVGRFAALADPNRAALAIMRGER